KRCGMFSPGSWQRMVSGARKEMLHIFRDRQTLFMTLFFPILQLLMLGYAIDTNARHIKTVVCDQDQTQASRAIVQAFKNSTVLNNPDTGSPNFFIPGLLVALCQMMAVTLSANAIVREKGKVTLEQLYMTPVRPGELILGKMMPYLVMTFVEFCVIAFLMNTL